MELRRLFISTHTMGVSAPFLYEADIIGFVIFFLLSLGKVQKIHNLNSITSFGHKLMAAQQSEHMISCRV